MSQAYPSPNPFRLLDLAVFETLKANIEQEQQVRDDLTQIVQRLERAVAFTQGAALAHAFDSSSKVLPDADICGPAALAAEKLAAPFLELQTLASKHPYYKYNTRWSRTVQNAVSTVILNYLLISYNSFGELRLLTIEQVGDVLNVPVNLKDRDAFHITIEEYLLALTDVTSELSRLATNAVTLGSPDLAVQISSFVKDLFAGFQILNLKNDILRKRVDGVKYDVKRVEDVVYDLSLRNLIPKPAAP